jgi:hypothetical protein
LVDGEALCGAEGTDGRRRVMNHGKQRRRNERGARRMSHLPDSRPPFFYPYLCVPG